MGHPLIIQTQQEQIFKGKSDLEIIRTIWQNLWIIIPEGGIARYYLELKF